MTEDEIYEALGLAQPDTFALNRLRQNLAVERVVALGHKEALANIWRRTGNTTRMVVSALKCLLEKQDDAVLLSGNTLWMSKNMVKIARVWAVKLGIDPKRIVCDGRDAPGAREFYCFADGWVQHTPERVWSRWRNGERV